MIITQLTDSLQKLGYAIKGVSGKNVNVIVEGDRVSALKDIASRLNGKYNEKGGSSSIGRAELPGGFFVNAKPKGGGSGAGSDITTLAESAQCVYCAALWYGEDFSGETMKSVKPGYNVDGKIDDIINKLPSQWSESCVLTAKVLKNEFGGKRYVFHRGSTWVDALENHWKALNRQEKAFANLNKWSPADIYMVSQAGERIDLTKSKTITELNEMMLKAIKSKDIIGVSLKQVKGTANFAYKNVSADRYTYKFKSLTTGRRGFMMSGDSYIDFDSGSIQFRTFGSTWQGEIKGKTANMGKISGGPILAIMKKFGVNMMAQNEIVTKTKNHMDKFYMFYKHFEKNNALPRSDFDLMVNQKDQNWWISKFMSAQLMYYVDTHNDKDGIVSSMIGYAASESDMSGPYTKVS